MISCCALSYLKDITKLEHLEHWASIFGYDHKLFVIAIREDLSILDKRLDRRTILLGQRSHWL